MKDAKVLFLHKFFTLSGGVERVHLNLATALAANHVQSQFYVYDPHADPDGFKQLQASHPAHCPQPHMGFVSRLRHLFSVLDALNVSVVISATETANLLAWLVALRYPKLKIIYTRHCAFDVSDQKLAPWMIKLLYNLYGLTNQTIVAVSEGLRSELSRAVKLGRSSVNFIPNAVVNDRVRQLAQTNSEQVSLPPYFCAVGRLVEQKGFDLLLDAYRKALDSQPDLPNLLIVGTGPDESQLKGQASRLALDDKVSFYGFSQNPYYLIRHAEAFLLSSRHEGMPTVLVEAMYLDTPVIAFDCPTGPAELIKDGDNGFLVPAGDTDALARAIGRYEMLKSRSISSAVSGFEHQNVALAYMSHF